MDIEDERDSFSFKFLDADGNEVDFPEVEEHKPCRATPPKELLRQLLDCRVAKTEREHFAGKKIEELQIELDTLKYMYETESKLSLSTIKTNNTLLKENKRLTLELAKAKPVLDAAVEWKRYNQAKEGDYNKFVGANSRLNKAVRKYEED